MLLAIDDENGAVASTALTYGLPGAVMLELALAGRIEFTGKHLVVTNPAPTGDDILDQALGLIQASAKTRDAKHWVRAIRGKVKGLNDRVAQRLTDQGIVRREEHRTLGIFRSQRYPALSDMPEAEARDRLRVAVLGRDAVDRRLLALAGVVKGADLLKHVTAKPERKAAEARLNELLATDALIAMVVKAVIDAKRDDDSSAAAGAVVASTSG